MTYLMAVFMGLIQGVAEFLPISSSGHLALFQTFFGMEDVEVLVRRMQAGGTVGDGMRRHLVTLEREHHSLEQSMRLCQSLKDREERLDALDAAGLLEEMDQLEKAGTTFRDKQKQDAKPVRYAGAVVMALLTTALMTALIALMVWVFTVDTADAPPLPLLLVLVAIPGVIILGVLLALVQRIREIQKGEEDDAKNY